MITQKQCKNDSACLEEDDLFVLKCRLPTKAVDVELFRSPQVFHPKGHDADTLVHGLRFSYCKRRNDMAAKPAKSSFQLSIVPSRRHVSSRRRHVVRSGALAPPARKFDYFTASGTLHMKLSH